MNAGPEMLTLEQLGMYSAKFERGEIDEEKLDWAKCNACPSCGACSFIGTASTMQIMAEALGLALPGTALMPATSPDLLAFAREAGRQAVRLAKMEHMRPSDIVTMESFENAILVHAAISGSTNCLLHLPAIAHEAGIDLNMDLINEISARTPNLCHLAPAGDTYMEDLERAGGVYAVMKELTKKGLLDTSVMTVTGKTMAENLEGVVNRNPEIIRPIDNPYSQDGGIAVLKGNLAPEGCVVKRSAVAPEMMAHTGPARVFDGEEEAIAAIYAGKIVPGDVVVIRYEGPKGGPGMREMLNPTSAIAGMGLDKEKKEHKLLLEMLGLMDEMAQKVSELDADVGELEEYVEDLDSDLSDMEEVLFGDDEDECDCDEEDGCSCDEEEELSFDCPHCGKTVLVKAADIDYDESPVCEFCGKPFFVDAEDDGKDE